MKGGTRCSPGLDYYWSGSLITWRHKNLKPYLIKCIVIFFSLSLHRSSCEKCFFFLHPAVHWLTAGLIFDEGRGDEPKASRSDCVMQETPKSSAIVTPPCPALLFIERRIRFCTAWMAVSPRTDAQWSQEKQRLLCPSHHDHLCASLSVLFVALKRQHS